MLFYQSFYTFIYLSGFLSSYSSVRGSFGSGSDKLSESVVLMIATPLVLMVRP